MTGRYGWGGGGCLVVVLLSMVMASCGRGTETVVDGDLAFVNVNVIPMDSERVLEDQTVVVDDGKIVAVGSSDDVGPAEGVDVVEAEGQYLMPGMTEMHAHLPNPQLSDTDAKNLLFLYVANGVTTVRGMLGHPSNFDLRNQIDRGLIIGPQLYLGSVAMGAPAVSTPEQAEQLVREHKVAGYDLVKTLEGLTVETFDALAQTANAVGIPFGGHVSDPVGLRHALAAGQMSVDHLDNYIRALVPDELLPEPVGAATAGIFAAGALLELVDESLMPELVQATLDADAWVVPTMALWETAFYHDRSAAELSLERPELKYMPPETVEAWKRGVDARLAATDIEANRGVSVLRRRILRALYEGGVKIAAGTDSPRTFSVPGFANHHEMAIYVDVGMSPYDALETATRKPAKYFGATDEFGTVAVGLRADLILLTANPIDDIANATSRVGVMVDGRWFAEDEIQRRLDEIARFYGN